jgi:hypothetical protein
MALILVDATPSRTSKGFSVRCTNKGKGIAVLVPFLVIDHLEAAEGGTYLFRLGNHRGEILEAAQRNFNADKMEDGVINITSDDLYDDSVE